MSVLIDSISLTIYRNEGIVGVQWFGLMGGCRGDVGDCWPWQAMESDHEDGPNPLTFSSSLSFLA